MLTYANFVSIQRTSDQASIVFIIQGGPERQWSNYYLALTLSFYPRQAV